MSVLVQRLIEVYTIMTSHEEFSDERLETKVVLLNQLLKSVLNSNKQVKDTLLQYFERYNPRNYDGGIKKFNLQSWCGSDLNPTLELVMANEEFKFGETGYGTLGPLKDSHLEDDHPIKREILIFFTDPKKYISEKIDSDKNRINLKH